MLNPYSAAGCSAFGMYAGDARISFQFGRGVISRNAQIVVMHQGQPRWTGVVIYSRYLGSDASFDTLFQRIDCPAIDESVATTTVLPGADLACIFGRRLLKAFTIFEPFS